MLHASTTLFWPTNNRNKQAAEDTKHGSQDYYWSYRLQIPLDQEGLCLENKAYTLKISFTKHSTFADRGISVHGPNAWYELPDDVRSTTNYNDFKKKLKTS